MVKGINGYKVALALLVGLFLAGMLVTLLIAGRRVSRVVDADYYSHGLHYGRTANGDINRGLDWIISATLSGGNLQVCVKDEHGAPVPGGRLQFSPERVAACGPLALAESAPGVFSAPYPAPSQGEVHGTLRFTRGDAVATQKLVLFN